MEFAQTVLIVAGYATMAMVLGIGLLFVLSCINDDEYQEWDNDKHK